MKNKINAYVRLMRLDKPIGILLLLWPTLTALVIASAGVPSLPVALVFIIGTILMRSAGCVMNDIADARYDGFVKRTLQRPLVTKVVTKKEAYFLLIILCVLGFLLVSTLNTFTIKLSFLALFFAISYPFTKRFFAVPQAYLGIAFGFGILMAFSATTNAIPKEAWWLFVANIFWAVAYDTEYAMVDRDDDLKIGIHSSAITFGQYDVLVVMLCYLNMLLLMLKVGLELELAWPYFVCLFVAAGISVYHYNLIKLRERALCFKAFLHNTWFGFALFLGAVLGKATYCS